MEFVYVLSFGNAADRRPAGRDTIRIAKTEVTRCVPGEHTIIQSYIYWSATLVRLAAIVWLIARCAREPQ